MKKLSLFCSVLIAALAGCNNDVTTNNTPDTVDGAITMNAFVPKMSRGSNATVGTLQADGFYTFAYQSPTDGTYGSPFMNNVEFNYNATNKDWISTPIYYWPQYALDFFCYSPDVMTSGSTTPQNFDYTVAADAKDEVDVLMTYAAKQTQPTTGNPLELAFHHALSKVNFVVQTQSGSDLDVKVNNISVKNVLMKGNIAYNLAATKMPYFNVTGQTTAGSPIVTPAAPIVLTAAATGAANVSSAPIEGMFLMPQALTPWQYSTANSIDMTGTYINISGELSGVTAYTGDIAIPITTTNWAPGYSYTYTILFGNGGTTGGGGYNPNKPNPGDTTKPQQILVPITISVTVDEWVDFTPPINVDL